ncbi:MAG: hypothetical protein AAF602_25315 [Myxococcota bacterium]
MRSLAGVASLGLVAAVCSVTLALLGPRSAPDQADWASHGLARLDVGALACDPDLPDGPSPEALKARLRTVTPTFMPCFTERDATADGTLHLSMTIDCTGTLADITVIEDGDWSPDVVQCTRDALGLARFPAHGRSNGYTFDFPVRYSAP